MTTATPPGWYPDPTGKRGQMYWNGQQWQTDIPAPLPVQAGPPGSAVDHGGSAAAKPDTTTSLMGLWSLLIGLAGIGLDFLCGVGIVAGLIGLAVGFIALNRSKQTNAKRGLVFAGLAASGVATLLGLALLIFVGSMFSSGGHVH